MALHWKHIKGFNGETLARTLDTYFHFKGGPTSGDYQANLENYLPDISITAHGNSQDGNNCGHIITSNINNTFTQYQTFTHIGNAANGIRFYEHANNVDYTHAIYTSGSNWQFLVAEDGDMIIGEDDAGNYVRFYNGGYMSDFLSNVNVTQDLTITGTVHCSSSGVFDSELQALFFNATSDIRAKENLQLIPSNMLDIVKQMEVYTFNYKNDPSAQSIGLIAQDLQNININGFTLVDNPNATGDNNDYMSIHESKLVYILIEAVKELSAKVDALERELYGRK